MTARVYNADQVTVVYGTVILNAGHGEDEFCRIETESDLFEDMVGAGGEVVRSATNDRRADVTITLLQTAPENALLSAIANVQKATKLGSEPLIIQDQNGTSVYKAEQAWIKREPDPTFGRSASTREWVIRCAELVRFDGGNNAA